MAGNNNPQWTSSSGLTLVQNGQTFELASGNHSNGISILGNNQWGAETITTYEHPFEQQQQQQQPPHLNANKIDVLVSMVAALTDRFVTFEKSTEAKLDLLLNAAANRVNNALEQSTNNDGAPVPPPPPFFKPLETEEELQSFEEKLKTDASHNLVSVRIQTTSMRFGHLFQ